jgi:protein involved in polysaccharide export with SLBB domain
MMSKLARYIWVIGLIFLLCGLGMVSAQDESGGAGAEATADTSGQEITFAGAEDTSLFVGFYRINAGDTVKVEIMSSTVRSYTCMISEEGNITLPVIGPVLIAGLTSSEAREELQKLADQYFQRAWVTVQVMQLAKVKFYVYGDVAKPGFYTASGATTVLDFLQGFGLASTRAHRRIVHARGNPSIALPDQENLLSPSETPLSELINLGLKAYDTGDTEAIDPRVTIIDPLAFTLRGELEQRNFYLGLGDVIFVPNPLVLVNLDGFTRSGRLEMLPGETLADAVDIGGPPLPVRDPISMVLERRSPDGRLTQLFYNLGLLDREKLAQIPVQNNDNIKLLTAQTNVFVLGAVEVAGAFPYAAASTPLDYLSMAGGPKPEAHLRFAVILRPSRDPAVPMENSQVIPVDLVEPFLSGAVPPGLAMQAGDILFIPDKGEQMNTSTLIGIIGALVNTVRLF